jgi:hypothetical protein
MSPTAARIRSLKSRIAHAEFASDAARLVRKLGATRDVRAIAVLIELLDAEDNVSETAARTLVRFGEAAVPAQQAYVASDGEGECLAQEALDEIAFRDRLAQVGGF